MSEKKSVWGEKELMFKHRDSLSELSSTYYSVAGSSFVWVKKFPIKLSLYNPMVVGEIIFRLILIPFWLLLGIYCFLRMLPTSNKMLKIASGYENLTADNCDIRQSILRKRRMWEKAWLCINRGLEKTAKLHTKAFLFLGKAHVIKKLGPDDLLGIKFFLNQAMGIAQSIDVIEPNQSIRIYRHCANFYHEIGEESLFFTCRKKADELAQQIGAKDQLLKI